MTHPQILIVQTEAAADAAKAILGLPAHPAIGFDWPSLAGRRVILWPSNTPASLTAFKSNLDACWGHGATQVKMIQPGPLDAPRFDAVVAQAEGWDRDAVLTWLRERAQEQGSPAPRPVPDIRTEAEITGDVTPPTAPDTAFDPAAPLVEQWAMLGLEQTKAGVVANEDTVLRVLERHPEMQGLVWYDEFLQRVMTMGHTAPREWGEADEGRLLSAFQRELGIARIKPNHVRIGVLTFAYGHPRNCAKDWLKPLKWDGIERISAFFPDYCGSADTAYARAVGRNFFVSMVARVFEPGCKVDNMIVLEGAQGGGKSSMLEAIGGAWYSVQHEQVTGKGFFEVLQGRMLVEIAEMDAFGKAEVTRVKQVVTTRSDRYRAAYAHTAKDYRRTSVFAGTTNKDDWNRDETGARRFWPIRVEQTIDVKAVAKARDQLFAEAVMAYLAKPVWWVVPTTETEAEQEARRDEDAWVEPVRDWLVGRAEVSVRHALVGAISLALKEIHRPEEMRMAKILRELKWTKRTTRNGKVWSNPAVLLPLGGNSE